MTIITIKWGNRYPADYVNLLYDATRRHGLEDSRFICFTDDSVGLHPGIHALPLPEINLPEKYRWTYWRKLALFDPALGLTGACLYFDLDVVITGDLRPLIAAWAGHPRFIRNWVGAKSLRRGNYERINSSVMLFKGSSGAHVLDLFHADQQAAFSSYSTDQGFIHDCFADEAEFFQEGLCVSFKRHCLPKFPLNLFLTARVPDGNCVVCFHGKPDPHEAAVGYHNGRLKHHCKPVPWARPL